MKQSNICGAKGLTTVNWGDRETSLVLRNEAKKKTKLSSLTELARRNSRTKFISLAHLLTEEFLKECFKDLKRDKAVGVDGVSVKEYESNLDENIKDLVSRFKENEVYTATRKESVYTENKQRGTTIRNTSGRR